MLKRLLGQSQIERVFCQCKIDKTHDMMFTKKITDLAFKYFSPSPPSQSMNVNINIHINNNIRNNINIKINNSSSKKKQDEEKQHKKDEFIRIILKKLRSSSDVQKIKGFVVVHSIIRKTFSQEFMDIISGEIEKYIVSQINLGLKEEKERTLHSTEKIDNSQKEFIQKNILSFYSQYLTKLILNIDTFQFTEKYLDDKTKKGYNIIQLINNGFVILNLCNYILQSQYTFNKMGRYYLEYNQIINLFMMYLNDLILYNAYIKQISKLSIKNIKTSSPQEIRHHFLFVNQSQKTSDRLYEFFYNRYYYTQVKKIILMPTFLNIHSEEYNMIADHVKKNDPQLAYIVKNSKFQGRSRSKTFISEEHDLDKSKMNKTDFLFNNENEFFSILTMMQEKTSEKELDDLEDITIKKFTFPNKK